MLALPAKTLAAGFVPSSGALLLCWVYMAASGLLIAEVNVNTLCATPPHRRTAAAPPHRRRTAAALPPPHRRTTAPPLHRRCTAEAPPLHSAHRLRALRLPKGWTAPLRLPRALAAPWP